MPNTVKLKSNSNLSNSNFMNYLFCAYRGWALKLYEMLSNRYKNMYLINSKKNLTLKNIQKINPKFIFFPDWSWLISSEIVENYTCVCFHESNLPKFRGGSPIQNQIIRGIEKTKTTAFIMNEKLDSIGIDKQIMNLKPEYRILIDMAYFKGYTQDEIAKLLNIPLGTVKTRIRNAILELKKMMT